MILVDLDMPEDSSPDDAAVLAEQWAQQARYTVLAHVPDSRSLGAASVVIDAPSDRVCAVLGELVKTA